MSPEIIEGKSRVIEPGSLVVVPEASLAIERAPDVVLAEAHTAAVALKNVIDGKPNKVMMGGEPYLEFEDWALLGRFYGVTARADEAEYVELGNAQGFRAVAVALKNGEVISQATAFCLNDETKWSERATYVWGYVLRDGSWSEEDPGPNNIVWVPNPGKPGKQMPKKERRMTGVEPVPLFQLASMAQTRAAAKCLRNVLAWVVVLAGYRPTPAEELDQARSVPSQAAPPVWVTDTDDPLAMPEEPEAPPARSAPLAAPAAEDTNDRVDDPQDPLWAQWLDLRIEASAKNVRTPIITLPCARLVLRSATDSIRRQLGAPGCNIMSRRLNPFSSEVTGRRDLKNDGSYTPEWVIGLEPLGVSVVLQRLCQQRDETIDVLLALYHALPPEIDGNPVVELALRHLQRATGEANP